MQKIAKPIIIIAILVLVGVSAYMYLTSNENTETGNGAFTTGNNEISVAENKEALIVENQKAGTLAVVKKAELPAPGFVVIYRDAGDRPGGIIAQSELLEKGTYKDIQIKTEVYPTEKDKSYFVMINLDDGDKEFNAGKDMPVADQTGGSYMPTFKAL